VVGTNLQNVLENVSGHKSLRFSVAREICTINGTQILMDLQYLISDWQWFNSIYAGTAFSHVAFTI